MFCSFLFLLLLQLVVGDIGRWNPDGTLSIIDRKKNIFKLSQGEYIAPEAIENVYARSKFVAQSFVYGDSLQSHLVAIVVPDEPIIMDYAKKNGINVKDFKELCTNSQIKSTIYDDMVATGVSLKLNKFEQVKDIYLSSQLFSVDNGILTPTQKLKRPIAKETYKSQIADMYARIQKNGNGNKAGRARSKL
jgi:long-chain acyl-CoA synthetase